MRALRQSRPMQTAAALTGVAALVCATALVNRLVLETQLDALEAERSARLGQPQVGEADPGWNGTIDPGMPIAGPAEYGVKYYIRVNAPRPVRNTPMDRPERRVMVRGDTVIEQATDGVTFWKRDQNEPSTVRP